MIYPLVRELAAENIPVAVTCRVLGFFRAGLLQMAGQSGEPARLGDAHLTNAAYDIHRDDLAFGYRFIADELRERGVKVGGNRVARLCSQQRIRSVFRKKPGLNRVGACGDNAAMESFFRPAAEERAEPGALGDSR
jgi:putative transposase